MIGPLVSSGAVRAAKAREEMRRMEKCEPQLASPEYRKKIREGHHGAGKAARATEYEDPVQELRKATREVETAKELRGRAQKESFRFRGDREVYGNRIAVKGERDRTRRREFQMKKDAAPANNEEEMEKR